MTLRILLVEDDRAQREMYVNRLQADGYYVAFAPSALKAVDLLITEEAFDLVLLDYELEGTLSGLEVSGYIHNASERTGKKPPAVFLLTGYTRIELDFRTKVRNPLEGISLFFFKGLDDFDKLWKAIAVMAQRRKEDVTRVSHHLKSDPPPTQK